MVGAAVSPPASCRVWPRHANCVAGPDARIAQPADRRPRVRRPVPLMSSTGRRRCRHHIDRVTRPAPDVRACQKSPPRRKKPGEPLIRSHRRQPIRHIDLGTLGVSTQNRRRGTDLQGGIPILRQPAFSERDGGGDHLPKGQFPPLGVHEGVSGRRRRDREREWTVNICVALDLRPREQILLHASGQPKC